MLTLLAFVSSQALGHPVGATIPSHQMQVEVSGGQLSLRYSARLPTRWIIKEIGEREGFTPEEGEAFTAQKLQELADGIQLTIDDQPTSWVLAPTAEPTGLGDRKFLTYDLSLSAPLPVGSAHAVQIRQSNYPDEHSYFMAELTLEPKYRVTECSLFRIEDGLARFSRYGQWRMEEEMRELSFRFEEPGGPLSRWLRGGAGGAPLPATDLVARGQIERLLSGEWTREAAAGAALLTVFGIGLIVWRRFLGR